MSDVTRLLNMFRHMPIRTLIDRIGLTVALLVMLVTPLTYWLVSTRHLHADLNFKAKLNADRVARLIFTNEQLWQYQGLRIAELIEFGNSALHRVHQRVVGPSGSTVVEVGPTFDFPRATVTQAIVVREQTLGQIELRASLWPAIYRTLLVSLLSSLLGLAAYYVLRTLPLAALDRTMASLETAHEEVRIANEELAQKNAELAGLNQNLERQVAERTAEAKAAAEEAKQASQVKSAFLASMSHEIRTPMNGVIGMADLLTRTHLTTQQQRLVTTINQSARTLLSIINDILDFSRIEAGKMELDSHEFDLRQCVESAIEVLAEAAHKKGVELSLLLPGSVPALVIGDEGRLRQILVNLIGNAVKFTKEGEITIRVTDCGVRNGKAVLRFAVADTGIGIAPALQARLFKPFSQADSSISRSFGGTGLGLSITQNLVQLMDGHVELESEIGKGTTVTFEIALPKGVRIDYQPIVCPAVIRGEQVLVVDDRAVNREIISSYLEDCGALTTSASSAEEALTILRASAADGAAIPLVVIDMVMPGMNGFELAKRIKSAPELAQARLIMVTSLSWKGDSQSARDVGIGEFLTKPVRRSELLDAVRRSYSKPAKAVPSPDQPQASTTNGKPLDGTRVLLAEDNPVNQEVAREYASSLGCECHVAENGRLAVEAFSASTFDVVLMDCQMPEMDGLAACRKIRDIERERGLARTPVIAVTANAYESDRQMCIAADMDDFISKPFTEDELSAMLTKWMRPAAAQEKQQSAADNSDSIDPSSSPALESLDLSALEAFEKQREGMASRLCELFLITAPKAVRQIMLAIVETNHELIRSSAHSLKSASGNVGARELQRLATIIETQSRDEAPMAECLATAAKLEAEMCKVETVLGQTSWMKEKRKTG